MTWESILYGFLFNDEAWKINRYLTDQGNNIPIEKRREVLLALQMNECQFTCETVTAYLQEEQKISTLAADDEENFQSYIRMKVRSSV